MLLICIRIGRISLMELNMNIGHVSSPPAQSINRDVETQTVGNNDSSTSGLDLFNFYGRCMKNILTDNFLLQLENPKTRADLRKIDSSTGAKLLGCCGVTGATACTLSGFYLDHSCAVIFGQAFLGCILGCQTGRNYEAFLQSEVKRQDSFLNDNAEIINSDVATTRQPVSATTTVVDTPPSYQSLVDSGEIDSRQVRCRSTNSST